MATAAEPPGDWRSEPSDPPVNRLGKVDMAYG